MPLAYLEKSISNKSPVENPEASESAHGQIALAFARALAFGNFGVAYRMLAPSLRDDFPPNELKRRYEQMIRYAGKTAAKEVELMSTLEFWPGRQELDLGWAYVSISGPNEVHGGVWNEAVSVVVEDRDGRLFVREIDWGRP